MHRPNPTLTYNHHDMPHVAARVHTNASNNNTRYSPYKYPRNSTRHNEKRARTHNAHTQISKPTISSTTNQTLTQTRTTGPQHGAANDWDSAKTAWSTKISNIALQGLAKSTQSNYLSTWRAFEAFCDSQHIDTSLRFPADELVLCAFAASKAGTLAGGTAANQIAGLKTWHAIRNKPWAGGARLAYVLKGVNNLAPESSRKAPRPPITPRMLQHLHDKLDLNLPRDAAVFAVATTAFWGQCRLGELLATSRRTTHNLALPSVASLGGKTSLNGSRELHLPKTKTNQKNGQTIVLTRQEKKVDPLRAIALMLQANNKQPREANLFLFREGPLGTMRALTKELFLARCNEIWTGLGYKRATGHCFRIGGTTELLQSGTPVDLVKSMGRWKSDAFQRYWRGLGAIAAQHVEFLKNKPLTSPRATARQHIASRRRQAVPA